MDPENNPDDSQPGADGSATADNSNVSNSAVLEAINSATNRSYKSEEEALKGIQETVSYVGKVGKYKNIIEAIEAANGGEAGAIEALKKVSNNTTAQPNSNNDDIRSELEALREENFFIANSELASQKELIKRLRKPGQSLNDVISENKDILDQLKTSVEGQQSKSIIHSNSRTVVEDSDYQADMKKAKETGNWAEFISKHKKI